MPQECLILTMKANQKYFPLLDAAGKLTNKFLVVSNIRPADAERGDRRQRARGAPAPGRRQVLLRPGPQEVARPTACRAWRRSSITTSSARQGERVQRVARHRRRDRASSSAARRWRARPTAPRCSPRPTCSPTWSANSPSCKASWAATTRARRLSRPTSPTRSRTTTSRASPATRCRAAASALVVALADKLETLVGMFGIGQLPTGDKDPFALRRHALGVIRMLVEATCRSDRSTAARAGCAAQFGSRPMPSVDRRSSPTSSSSACAGSLREQGYSAQEVDAVLAACVRSASATSRSASPPCAPSPRCPKRRALAAANKRIGNILKKADGAVRGARSTPALLEEAGRSRARRGAGRSASRGPTLRSTRGDYTASLQALAALRAPVDTFFDDVMVNAEDPALRANRLGLLGASCIRR